MIIIFIIHYITLDTRKSYTALYLFVKTLVKITALKKTLQLLFNLMIRNLKCKKKKKKKVGCYIDIGIIFL